MAPSVVRAGALFIILGLSITSLVFVLLGVTSQQWAVRHYYNSSVPEDWQTPMSTIYRNPFKLCTTRPNFNESVDADGIESKVLLGYNTTCQSYSPSGTNTTSCELPWVLKSYRNLTNTLADAPAIRGDSRLCQQIHYAGSFAISGTIFVSFGAIMTICTTLAAGYALKSRHRGFDASETSPAKSTSTGKTETQATVIEANSTTKSHNAGKRWKSMVRNANFITVNLLRIGVILILLSQYYGVQGLIQSSPNNSDFSSSAYGTAAAEDGNVYGYHGPWYQGKGLSLYMTCAWAFALATSVLAAKLWRT